MTDTLTALDATFLELEEADDTAHMHIGGVLVFEAPDDGRRPAVDEVRREIAQRVALLPRYRQRLSKPRTGGLAWPQWEDDPRFDLDAHVRGAVLPAPGGDAELLDFIADFYSHRLDRTRPLWEIVVLEGLADGCWALCWKTHHTMVDGVGSVDVAHLLLDSERHPPARRSSAGDGAVAPQARGRRFVPPGARAAATAARAGIHAARHPLEAVKRSTALVDLLVREEVVGAPKSSLNEPIGATRRMGVVRIALADLKAIKNALGGTVNDVVLTATATGLRDLLLARGEELPAAGLRAMVPVNVRADAEHGGLGNKIASLFVQLPVAEPDLRERYTRVLEETSRLKHGSQKTGTGTLLELFALAPPVVHHVLARSLFANRLFNVTVTNVPGPQRRLYARGAALLEVIPLVPLAAEHAVGIAVVSYDGTVFFGINADRRSVPDLDVLVEGIESAIRDLRAMSARTT